VTETPPTVDTDRLPVLALVVVEADHGIVMVHPPSGPPDAPASLPSGLVQLPETPETGAIRIVSEQTGLQVELIAELTHFVQDGTPYGSALMVAFVARVVGGSLAEGDEGPVAVYPIGELPTIIPVRVANQRVLSTYLESRATGTSS
jgi:ADP-ribose pyrophosphatase YjhB (NUDIX family)